MPTVPNVLPDFARELAAALAAMQRPDLAAMVSRMEVVDVCRCAQPGCATFYGQPKADTPDAAHCERVIPTMKGVSCAMIHDGKIVWIEPLDRPAERAVLAHFPVE